MRDETFLVTRTASRSEDDLPNEFGYTCTGAAIALADMCPPISATEIEKAVETALGHCTGQDDELMREGLWQREYRFWANEIFKAVKAGELKVRNPSNGSLYEPKTARIFYDRISVEDLNGWLKERGAVFRLGNVAAAAPVAVPAFRAQEQAILDAIKTLGYDHKALPRSERGRRGVKHEVRSALRDHELFTGGTTFDKAWERV